MNRRHIIGALAAIGLFAAAPCSAQSDTTNETLVRTMFAEVWSRGDYGSLESLLTPDFVFHFRGRAMPMNVQQFQGMVDMWRKTLNGLEFRIEEVVTQGDRAAARLTFTGTHAAEAFGVQPTGRAVSVTMMAFFRFADGRIAELWEDYDEHGLRQQLTRPVSQ
jgi:steroid delta-isomerase-like uncharacterized protein